MPLDSTNHVPIDITTVERFKRRKPSSSLNTIIHVFSQIRSSLIEPGFFYAWDPLAAVALMEEDFYLWQEVTLTVNTQLGKHYGETFKDPEGSQVSILVPRDGFDLREEWESRYLEIIAPPLE